jgi:HD-GYP domain-containing protein (c-di-GMP phosphodiesterase class II)
MVRTHHWRPDGKGYPPGLSAADVPLGARIINVCDAFDAMTSDRPYRRGLAPEKALIELRKHAGTQFDLDLVVALAELHEVGLLGNDGAEEEPSVEEVR